MAKNRAAKKTRKRAKTVDVAVPSASKTVSIDRAKNGYVVRTYGPKGECIYVANNKQQANEYAGKLLGTK